MQTVTLCLIAVDRHRSTNPSQTGLGTHGGSQQRTRNRLPEPPTTCNDADPPHGLVLVAERLPRSDVSSSRAATRPRADRFTGGHARPRTNARPGACGRRAALTPHAPAARAMSRANDASAAALDRDAWDVAAHARGEANQGSRQEQRSQTRIVLSELKTAKPRRTLVLTPEIVCKLRTLHADQAKTRLAFGEAWQDHWHPNELRHSGGLADPGPRDAAAGGQSFSSMQASPSQRTPTVT